MVRTVVSATGKELLEPFQLELCYLIMLGSVFVRRQLPYSYKFRTGCKVIPIYLVHVTMLCCVIQAKTEWEKTKTELEAAAQDWEIKYTQLDITYTDSAQVSSLYTCIKQLW